MAVPMKKCCNLISDLITGVIPGVVDGDTEYITFAIIHDPAVGEFFDWQFVGYAQIDGCNFPNMGYCVWFGANTDSCYSGYVAVVDFFCDWSNTNGVPCPALSSADRDQIGEGLSTYLFAYKGDQSVLTPPDFQIVDSLASPQSLTWVTLEPECITITFTVDDPSNCYIQANMYGYNDITTYFFGSFAATPVNDPGWEAYFHSIIPKASTSTITSSIVGNDVTVTITDAFRFIRGIRWRNDVAVTEGTELFTACP